LAARISIAFAAAFGLAIALIVVLRAIGYLHAYRIPSSAMETSTADGSASRM
jgi:hypothetical protein